MNQPASTEAAASKSSSLPLSSRNGALAAPLTIALFLSMALPFIPDRVIDGRLEGSWHSVLVYAHQQGLVFGRDVVFTFGPLGYLFTYFTGESVVLRLVIKLAVFYVVCAGACLLAWRMTVGWRIFFLGLLVAVLTSLDTILETGLLCWGLLCWLTPGRKVRAWSVVLAALAAFAALCRFNLLLTAAATLIGLAGHHIALRQRRMAVAYVVFAPVLFLIGWVALGQNVRVLYAYLVNSSSLSQGYPLTMGTLAPPEMLLVGLVAAVLTLLVIMLRRFTMTESLPGYFLFPVWLVFLTFFAWKHGFVRPDSHVIFFFGFASILTAALDAIPSNSNLMQLFGRLGAVTVCLLAGAGMEFRSPGFVRQRTAGVFERFAGNLRVLAHPTAYRERMNEALSHERERDQLPNIRAIAGRRTLDVFGQYQGYALFNDLNYHPRPVFQSYCAYTPRLSRLNGNFYDGPDAPDFIMFKMEPLDNRWPSLEDSAALRSLLASYHPVEGEGAFLLLKHGAPASTNMIPVREGKAAIGEPILLSDLGSNDLWMEIRLKPTLISQIRQTLYKPPILRLCAWNGQPPNRGEQFRAPTPMLAAGFIVSPLLRDNFDVTDLFAGNSNSRPAAVSVELDPKDRHFYRSPFWFRIYTLDHQLGSPPDPSLVRLKWPGFKSFPIEAYSPMVPLRLTTIEEKPAVFVQPGGHLKFGIPQDATHLSGAYGLEESAYVDGTTDGAEFRVELSSDQETNRVLHSELLQPKSNPKDRGLHRFTVPLPPVAHGAVLLKVLPGPSNNTTWDLTCWAEIEIK